MTRSYFAALALLSVTTTRSDYSSAKQCYGPDYSEMYPFYGMHKDLCCHSYYNTTSTKALTISLSYGDTVFGSEHISDEDPDSDEREICDPHFPAPIESLHACSICLGFEDIFMADSWARICPKYILQCEGPFLDPVTTEYPTPCFVVGDDDSDDISTIVAGNTDFALKLLGSKAATEKIVQDLFISPFSITNALIMTMMAANGETLEQLLSAFELTSDDYAVFDSFDTIVQSLQHNTKKTQNVVLNKLWINSVWDEVIDPRFLRDFDRFGEIQSCDFQNHSTRETDKIDHETQSLTHGLIQHPLNGEQLSESTVMLFTNTMYFSGHWKWMFEYNVTETFTDDDGDDVTISMMRTNARKFPHFDDGEVEVIELPFNDQFSEISFVIIRPSLGKYLDDGPASTIAFEKALNRSTLSAYLDALSTDGERFNVTLPFLEMYNMEDVTESLQMMGVDDVFDPKRADLTNLTVPRYQVYETNLNRQDFLKLTPQGAQMASFVTDGNDDGDQTNQGQVDHADLPFLFLVMDRSVDLILYAGRVTNPKGWIIMPEKHEAAATGSRVGTVLAVLLLVGSVSYLIIKYIYNRSVIGLSGMDAVPHIGVVRGCGRWIKAKGHGNRPVPGAGPKERYAPMMNEMGL